MPSPQLPDRHPEPRDPLTCGFLVQVRGDTSESTPVVLGTATPGRILPASALARKGRAASPVDAYVGRPDALAGSALWVNLGETPPS